MSEHAHRVPPSLARRVGRVLAVGLAVPLLAAAALVWSTEDRQQEIGKIPVAIVNDDTILSSPQPMAAGRALAASLTDPADSDPRLDWKLTDDDDAASGLRSGSYYAVLTIPKDFSSAIVSTGTDTPSSGQLQLRSNAAASTTVPYISEQVVAAAATALGNQSTQGYLKNVYDGFNQIAKSNQSAASSASSLADGTQQVSDGATNLDEGAGTLAGSLDQLAAGATELESGAASVRRGADQVAGGAGEVARGTRQLDTGVGALAGSTRALASRGAQYAGRAREVARGASVVDRGATRVAGGARLLAGDLARLDAQCAAAGGSVPFCNELGRAATGARVLGAATGALDRATGGLARADAALARGAGLLADAERRVAAGARKLDKASGRLATSTSALASGARSVAAGAASVDSATGSLAGGSQQAAAGGTSLAEGSASLSAGAVSANDGAHQLSSGLAKGAKQSPTYSSSLQTALADTVSEPVVLHHRSQHTSHGNGWLAAAIVAVTLWLAALVAVLGVDVTSARRNALAPVSSRRIAVTQVLPVLGLALLQAGAVVLVLTLLKSSMAAPVTLALMTVLAALTFSLVGYALRLAFGGLGIAVFVLVLLVQLAALGNVVPLETAPSLLQVLNGLLPLTVFINGTSQLVSGGDVGSPLVTVVVLALWAVAAFGATVAVVKRRRMTRSRPPVPMGVGMVA